MNTVPLSDIADFVNGYAFKPSDWEKEGLRIIRIQNLTDSSKAYNRTSNKFSDKYKVYTGDILVSWSATLDVFEWQSEEEAWLNQHIFKVVLNNGKVDKDYFKHALRFSIDKMKQFTHGSTMKHIVREDFLKHRIPLPPLDEQKEIVKTLDQADELRSKRRQATNLLDEYLKAIFLEMFGDPVTNPKGWDTMNGAEYSELLTVGVVIKPASYYRDKGVIALRSLNIKPNAIDLENVVYFSDEDNNGKLSKSKLRTGDVVIVRTGLTGTSAVIPEELDGVNCIDLIIVRPKTEVINPMYLCFLLNSDIGKQLISKREVGGIQKHFNVGSLKLLTLPIPPADLQTKFAQIVNDTDVLKQKMYRQSEELDNQFQALMQKSFNSN